MSVFEHESGATVGPRLLPASRLTPIAPHWQCRVGTKVGVHAVPLLYNAAKGTAGIEASVGDR